MTSVTIREVRERLSELVEAAEGGETIIITRRGRKVARLAPLRTRKGCGLPDLTEFRASLEVRGQSLTDDLIAMRDEERP